MSQKNRNGLSRDIPEPLKREVRQKCGFGCVICGASIVDYEHVDPEFCDAEAHDPQAIALLCPSCHGNVTRKVWSKGRVKVALSNPKCMQIGYSWGEFDFGDKLPTVYLGGNRFHGHNDVFSIDYQHILRVDPPEQTGAPFRLSACFRDSQGREILRIRNNEWIACSTTWDTEFTGSRMTFREAHGQQCMIIKAVPPEGIQIEKLNMMTFGSKITANLKEVVIEKPCGMKFTISGSKLGGSCGVINI